MRQYILNALLTVLLASCGDGMRESWPLCGDLEAFTQQAPGDTLTLTGIRHRVTGDTLVRPQHFIRMESDSFVVKATMPNKRLMVYSHRGRCIRGHSFDSFSKLVWEVADQPTELAGNDTLPDKAAGKQQETQHVYYIGTDYDRSFYYFPKRRRLVEITNAHITGEGFTVPGEKGDSVAYNYLGEEVR